MKNKQLFRLTFWKSVAIIIVAAGLYSTYFRIVDGLGAVTNLNDAFPWGLWIGFDILCGVGLAAGGFTICAVTHIFNIEKFKPLARPAILTAFLAYVLVIFALMFDLGRPYNIWHALIMWNPHSVMFEVAWCVMLYTTVLFLEFSPMLLERFKLKKIHSLLKKYLIPIMILGIILSTLHQSSLGSLYLIIPQKMHPLWYSSLLPIYFYLSAIGVGFGMVIFEAYLSARAFNHSLKIDLLSRIAKVTFAMLIISFIIKLSDLIISGKLQYLITPSYEMYMFYLEILVGTFVPVTLLGNNRIRTSRLGLYISAIFVIAGFLLNRLNVSVTSLTTYAGYAYFPTVSEISITMMIVVLGMWAFGLVVKNFPVFIEPHEIKSEEPVSSGNIILSE